MERLPGGLDSKASSHSAGDPGLIPVLGRSPGGGNGNPLQYSCLENSMGGGATVNWWDWWATVHGFTRSRTRLSDFTFYMEKEMATQSSILAWKIPWTEEPGRLQSNGLQIVGRDWATITHSLTHSAYKLSKQGDNTQPWRTPFPIWNQSIVPCLVLIVGFWPAFRYLRRQVRWSDIPISWRIFHSLLWSTQSKAWA